MPWGLCYTPRIYKEMAGGHPRALLMEPYKVNCNEVKVPTMTKRVGKPANEPLNPNCLANWNNNPMVD